MALELQLKAYMLIHKLETKKSETGFGVDF